MMALEWIWTNYPIGFPLEDRDDLGGKRTGPKCSLCMTYSDEGLVLKQSVMMNGLGRDITKKKKMLAKSLMLEWLAREFTKRAEETDNAAKQE